VSRTSPFSARGSRGEAAVRRGDGRRKRSGTDSGGGGGGGEGIAERNGGALLAEEVGGRERHEAHLFDYAKTQNGTSIVDWQASCDRIRQGDVD